MGGRRWKVLNYKFESDMKECLTLWDMWITQLMEGEFTVSKNYAKEANIWCNAKWEVYKLVMNEFYGIECVFIWTNEYFGVCDKTEQNWLFKIERATKVEEFKKVF